MLKLKKGTSLFGMKPEMTTGLVIASGVFLEQYGKDCVVTSGTERTSKHGKHTHHFKGLAGDVRVKHIDKEKWKGLTDAIQAALGSEFQVILEMRVPHIHIEYDPA